MSDEDNHYHVAEEEDYEYVPDYDDNGDDGDEGETWETEVENKYSTAKAGMDANPILSVKEFNEVIAEDQDKGRWTFKALKMLTRTYQRSKQYPEMVKTFEKMINFQFSDRNRGDIEKAINKFLGSILTVPTAFCEQVCTVALVMLKKEIRSFEKLWFNVEVRLLLLRQEGQGAQQQCALGQQQDEASIAALREWCMVGATSPNQVNANKGSQFLQILAIDILMIERRSPLIYLSGPPANADVATARALLLGLFQESLGFENAMPPPKVIGAIKQCGGKLYMIQSNWTGANNTFLASFSSFDEAGDSRRIASLKYLVLASMLSASVINPFHTPMARAYQNHPEIKAMVELIGACSSSNLVTFQRVLSDKQNSASITGDPFLMSYLAPLMRRVRLQTLVKIVKPYSRMFLAKVAEALTVSMDEAESYCVSAIQDGLIVGRVDQERNELLLPDKGDPYLSADATRFTALSKWADAIKFSQASVMTKLVAL